MNKSYEKQSGFALVSLMIFVIIGMIITGAATTILLINSLAASRMQQGIVAYESAESGIENGILRLLRDPINYTGETIDLENGTVVISVSADKQSITSVASMGNYTRKVQTHVVYSDNLTVTSWKEIY